MTIQEMVQKGKNTATRALSGDIFIALVVILVGLASFGLGRLSVAPGKEPVQVYQPGQAAGAVLSASETSSAASESPRVESAPTTSAGVGKYVASKNGSVYYLESCSGVKRIKDANKVWFSSPAAAENAGYRKAANCPGL